MPQKNFTRKSLELTPEQWRELDRIANSINAIASTGPTAGKPSWRSLIRLLADGHLRIIKAE